MNRNAFAGRWKQVKGRVREQWGKLTDEDLEEIKGRREALVGKIQERYGESLEAADKAVHEWFRSMDEVA